MKFSLTATSVLALVASAVAQGGLQINTPASAVVCQPLLLTWTGGTPPYFLSILPGNQPSAPALKDFGQVTGNSLTWTVNFEANTSLGLTLRDSSGTTAQSAAFTVQAGTDSSCVGKDPSSTAGGSTPPGGSSTTGGSPPATSPPATTAPPATTSAPGTTTTPPTSKPATSSGTTSAPSTTTTNAAVSNAVEFGAAGVVGAVLALLV